MEIDIQCKCSLAKLLKVALWKHRTEHIQNSESRFYEDSLYAAVYFAGLNTPPSTGEAELDFQRYQNELNDPKGNKNNLRYD